MYYYIIIIINILKFIVPKILVHSKPNRNSLLKRKEGEDHSNRNCFVVDYHPALRALYDIFRELHVIVSWSERFLRIMPEPPMVCFRRAKILNLKTIWFVQNCERKRKQSWGCLNVEQVMNLKVLRDGLFALIIVSIVTQTV